VADNRAFHSAILASLALHALALFAFPDFIDTARRAVSLPPQIIARLMEPEPVAPPVETPPPAPPVKKKESAPPKLVKPVPESATRPAPISDAEPEPPVTEPQPVSPPPVASVAPVPAPVPAAPRTEVSESLSRDQYRIELMAEAARHARTRYPPRGYPPLARENNWEGDVRVGVAVSANGRASITLKGSSGYEVLDQQALDSFRQAARGVALPQALRGKDFAIDVRATYRLED
jgi:periplasmic protein TonB